MITYPKTHNLYLRDNQTGKLVINSLTHREFNNVRHWWVEEKIDGTNIRIQLWANGTYDIKGRSDDAQLPSGVVSFAQEHFTKEIILEFFKDRPDIYEIVLFCEGYGPKIQSGGNYRDEISLCLFDARVNTWWLTREAVKDISERLELPTPHIYGYMNLGGIVDLVKSQPMSLTAKREMVIEGVIARSDPLMLMRNGDRVIFKLKCGDMK